MKKTLSQRWNDRPRLIDNPVIARELVSGLRRKNSFVYLAIFLVFGTLAFLSYWLQLTNSLYGPNVSTPFYRIRMFYYSYIGQLELVAQILIVFLCATSVNQEIRRGSWDLLRTTPINLKSILIGKMIAHIGFIGILTIAMIPAFSTIMIMGSIGPIDLLISLLMFGEKMLVMSLIGLYASLRWSQPVRAIFASLLIALGFFYLLPMIGQLIGVLVPFLSWVSVLMYLHAVYVFYAVVYPAGRFPISLDLYQGLTVHLVMIGGVVYLLIRGCARHLQASGERIREWRIVSSEIKKKQNSQIPPLSFPDWKNPIRIKEQYEILGRTSWSRNQDIILLFGMGLFLIVLFWGVWDRTFSLKNIHFMSYLSVIFTPLMVLPYAAGSFRAEKDKNTWELLISSPLTPQRILEGKFLAGLYLFIRRYWSLFAPWTIAVLFAYHNGDIQFDRLSIAVYTVLLSHVSAVLYLVVGLLCSIGSKKTTTAFVLPFLFAFLLLFGMSYLEPLFPTDPNDPTSNPALYVSPLYLVTLCLRRQELLRDINTFTAIHILWTIAAIAIAWKVSIEWLIRQSIDSRQMS